MELREQKHESLIFTSEISRLAVLGTHGAQKVTERNQETGRSKKDPSTKQVF